MKIDEEKQYGLHKLEKSTVTNENKKIRIREEYSITTELH